MDSWRTKTGACRLTFKMHLNLPHRLIFQCVLIVIYLTSTSGCWRRQAQVDNDDDGVASVAVDLISTTTQRLSHRLECLLEEAAYAGCLNGGTCFAIELHENSRHVQCSCTSEWQGERCERLYIDPNWVIEEAKEQATKLAIVLTFGITATILLIILVAFTVVYIRRRHKRAEEKRKSKEEEKRRHDKAGRSAAVSPVNSSSSQQQITIVIPISSV